MEDVHQYFGDRGLMNIEIKKDSDDFSTPGSRLNYILDNIGFKEGRGRVTEFQNYLITNCPESFNELKYTTVRSWFQDHTPPMKKVDSIIVALRRKYMMNYNIAQVKTWWKLGGINPFENNKSNINTDLNLQENITKTQFVVMSLVTEIAGEKFTNLSSDELVRIKNKAMKLANDFADPFQNDCPAEYLRLVIQSEIEQIENKS